MKTNYAQLLAEFHNKRAKQKQDQETLRSALNSSEYGYKKYIMELLKILDVKKRHNYTSLMTLEQLLIETLKEQIVKTATESQNSTKV